MRIIFLFPTLPFLIGSKLVIKPVPFGLNDRPVDVHMTIALLVEFRILRKGYG